MIPSLRWWTIDHRDRHAIREAPGKASLSLHPDEIVVIETPRARGWGRA
jgi:hypothetical protein